jgi:hypothetical protein
MKSHEVMHVPVTNSVSYGSSVLVILQKRSKFERLDLLISLRTSTHVDNQVRIGGESA